MIQKILFRDFEFYILRDDLLGEFNGNKARKLEYFLQNDLGIKGIVSHGSSQSNAMYSLSVFAKLKKIEFHYVVSYLNENLQKNPVGNFLASLENGMKLYIKDSREYYAKQIAKDKNLFFIQEGVAIPEAEYGFKTQASEIKNFALKNSLKFDIFLPSGTGTSASFLSKNIDFDVYTCPCVGNDEYLKLQIQNLVSNSKVKILKPPKKYHFGDLKIELFEIYKELKESTNIEFDLIYDPVGFITLFNNLDKFKNDVLYIHQGGVMGNISQKQRYERKFKKIYKNI
ncbi:1-aminocyclopropane-1-carboxylate deaminase [Campylobacter pinnipediorum subsp. caledonicus]|uniref:1-aminocyclopropane-1-carboxylate deaminase n=1 Tax=Campylobacter pinnipediorum TaxID=1965231 RepID=UPI00099498F7|nr:1-aminocyclopropane-1-carboxylate deaminase [Campylobacter pinnipediorum]OPA71393.1 1-aminocyclopropane-1-carboxylate deaminase [Campylobacter pinnipediorum subsp. caledonicus]